MWSMPWPHIWRWVSARGRVWLACGGAAREAAGRGTVVGALAARRRVCRSGPVRARFALG